MLINTGLIHHHRLHCALILTGQENAAPWGNQKVRREKHHPTLSNYNTLEHVHLPGLISTFNHHNAGNTVHTSVSTVRTSAPH